MSRVETDKEAAVRFLEWWFGKNPSPHFIGISYQHSLDKASLDDSPINDDEPDDARRKTLKVTQCVYSLPERAVMSQWDNESERNHIYFCTTPLLTKQSRLAGAHAAGLPGLWLDIDALRDLEINGDEFFVELKDQEKASCWTRSSERGIQAFFKLDEFFPLDGDYKTNKKLFKEEIRPLLLSMAYYFGGDLKVASLARNMRLPGSVNIKRDNYLCRATYYNHIFTRVELRKQFKVDEHLVPKVVFYALVKAMEKVYGTGNHHDPSLNLFGTCRQMGLDEGSCERLAGELCGFFKNMKEDPTPAVTTTYARDIASEGLLTLRNGYEDIADEVERTIKWWVAFKVKFCTAVGIRWKPDIDNPLASASEENLDDSFQVKSDGTYFFGKDGNLALFANFSMKILYTVRKLNGSESSVAELIFKNRRYQFEWSGERDLSFAQFKKILQVPSGATVLIETAWKAFIKALHISSSPKYLKETPYYGLLDAQKGNPTLILPGTEHETYAWSQTEHDTADPESAFKEVSKRDAIDYLTNFAKHYPYYHEKKYIWNALGWFAACPFSAYAYAREFDRGFPILQISGLKESGKSSLISNVLGPHLGCSQTQTYLDTTPASQRAQLSSNNLIPLLIDEFRDADEYKTKSFTNLVRAVWDKTPRRALSKERGATIDLLIGSLCIIGEHSYEDGATLDRTVSLHINRNFIESTFEMSEEEKERLLNARRWLESGERAGVLGSLLIQWMKENFDELPELLEKAHRIIAKTRDNSKQLRNGLGFGCIVFGLLIMHRLYASYDLEFPLDKDTMLGAIAEANEAISENTSIYGAANLKMLFQITDNVIISELRRNQTLEPFVYVLDKEDERYIYFDMTRWYDHIYKHVKGSASPTLINKTSFMDLLLVSSKNPNTPIVGFPTDHPQIRKACVKVALKVVEENFGINVEQWRASPEFRDWE